MVNKIGYEMDGILESMDKSSLTEEQILEVKSKMKEMDKN